MTRPTLEEHLASPPQTLSQLRRWGAELQKWGEPVCAQALAGVLRLFPQGNVPGVPFTHNQAFTEWLAEARPLLELHVELPDEPEPLEMLRQHAESYLTQCLPMVQPREGGMVAEAEGWQGVERLARTRWYNPGHVPQHRVALAVQAVALGTPSNHIGDVLKLLARLTGSVDEVVDCVRQTMDAR